MKLIQFIRPLFFVAVGLHVLVLFVPVGASDDPEVIEDVELSEVSEEKPAVPPPGPLPVPDPNVAAAPAAATAAKSTAAARPAARSTATRSSAARSTAARSAARSAEPNVAVADSSATPRPGSNTPSSNPSNNRPNNDRQPVTPSSENSSDENQDNGSFLSTFIDENNDEPVDSSNSRSGGDNEPSVLAALLGKVTHDLSAPFREFSRQLGTSLVYDATNTNDAGADVRRSEWKETLWREANIGIVEHLEPSELAELAKVAYPIESSVQTESIVQTDDQTIRLRGRNISLCLDKAPHDAEVGVLLDAEGDVVDEPVIIRSTGYEALNNEIKAKVVAFEDFPRNRTPKAYSFDVEVDYDAESCVSLADLKES